MYYKYIPVTGQARATGVAPDTSSIVLACSHQMSRLVLITQLTTGHVIGVNVGHRIGVWRNPNTLPCSLIHAVDKDVCNHIMSENEPTTGPKVDTDQEVLGDQHGEKNYVCRSEDVELQIENHKE
jgi:hypothetical protein